MKHFDHINIQDKKLEISKSGENSTEQVSDEYFEIARLLARIVVENHFAHCYPNGGDK